MVDEKTAEEALKAGNFEEIKRLLEQDKVGALAAFDGAGGTRRILDWRDNNDLAKNADRRKSIAFLVEQGLTNLDGLAFSLTLHHATYDEEEGLRLYSSLRPRFREADEVKIAQLFCEHPGRARVAQFLRENPFPAHICRKALWSVLERRASLNKLFTCPTEYLLPLAGDLAGPDLDLPYGNEKLRPLHRAVLWYPNVALALLDAGADPNAPLANPYEFRLPGNLESRKTELEFDAGTSVLTMTQKVRASLHALRKQYAKMCMLEPAVTAKIATYDDLIARLERARSSKPMPTAASESSSATWFRELCTAAGLPSAKIDGALGAHAAKEGSEWQKFCDLASGCSDLEPFLEERGQFLVMLMEGGSGSVDAVEEYLNDESRELLDAGEVLAVEDADLWVLANDTVSLLRPSGASRVGSVSELIGQAISD